MVSHMASQAEKGKIFRALHESDRAFIPNPWDVGTARLLREMQARGTFAFAEDAVKYSEINEMFA